MTLLLIAQPPNFKGTFVDFLQLPFKSCLVKHGQPSAILWLLSVRCSILALRTYVLSGYGELIRPESPLKVVHSQGRKEVSCVIV